MGTLTRFILSQTSDKHRIAFHALILALCGIPHKESHNFCHCQGVKPPRNIIGPVVRELREKQGLTQTELVAKLNLMGWDVSRDIIARIEGQIRWVADFEIVKLAEAVDLDAPALIRQAMTKGAKRPQSLPALIRPPSK